MTTFFRAWREARKVLVLGSLFAATAAFAAPNLLSNASFELPVLTPGSDYLIAPVGSSVIPSWSVTGAPGKNVAIIEALCNLPDAAGINFAAADGVQWIDIAGAGANATEGVLQSVSLVSGAYNLTFDIGNVVAAAAGLGTQSKTDLFVNGIFAQSFTNSASGGSAINWQTFSYNFNAAGLTSIEFRNADGATDNLNGLDNVILIAVPEPSTAVFLLLGLVAIVTRLRSNNLHVSHIEA